MYEEVHSFWDNKYSPGCCTGIVSKNPLCKKGMAMSTTSTVSKMKAQIREKAAIVAIAHGKQG